MYNEHPGPWQYFTKRADNVGLNIMEVRRKYLQEQLLYEQFVSHQMQQQYILQQQQAGGGRSKKDKDSSASIPATALTLNGGEITYNEENITYTT